MEQIEITDRAASQVSRGGLWIFSNEVYKKPSDLKRGAWCTFRCRSKAVATGYANPNSLIFGRVIALGAHDDAAALLRKRLEQAFSIRATTGPRQAARLVYSEGDFLPGLILDLYADHAVLQSNTAGVDAMLADLERLIPTVFEQVFGRKLRGFVVKADSGIRRLEGVEDFTKVVLGDQAAMRSVEFEEDGTRFAADLLEGQKTGFFLDQRDNRGFLAKLCAAQPGKRVLDLFCYSGGWGLRALAAGAAHVAFVDESEDALRLVERGFELNGFDLKKTRRTESDAFRFLEQDGDSFDIIVADPPAFVKSKKNLPQALKAYEKLNRLAWRKLKPGGVLISSSCSYHVTDQDFLDMLRDAVGKEKSWSQILYRGSQAADHPVLLSMPETRYLKCVALQKIDALSN